MTTSSFRQLALNSEPPSRRELSLAILALSFVLFAVIAGRAVDYFGGTNMETWAPSSHAETRARFA